jgi:hypothetical protein
MEPGKKEGEERFFREVEGHEQRKHVGQLS